MSTLPILNLYISSNLPLAHHIPNVPIKIIWWPKGIKKIELMSENGISPNPLNSVEQLSFKFQPQPILNTFKSFLVSLGPA